MKKIYTLLVAVLLFIAAPSAKAQTTAMDFNIVDCNGTPHHLFADLDAGKAVIIEFFMTSCSPCVTAGQHLEAMKADLEAEYPGQIKAYAFGFNNTYTCTTVNNWLSTNGFTSFPSDSGATQVAYYGGMGMPTIVILGGGSSHLVLGTPYIGFTTADTVTMANDIRNFLDASGVSESAQALNVQLYPNPANAETRLEISLKTDAALKIDLIDVSGRVVAQVFSDQVKAGVFAKTIPTSALAKGSYIIRMEANGTVFHQKLNIFR